MIARPGFIGSDLANCAKSAICNHCEPLESYVMDPNRFPGYKRRVSSNKSPLINEHLGNEMESKPPLPPKKRRKALLDKSNLIINNTNICSNSAISNTIYQQAFNKDRYNRCYDAIAELSFRSNFTTSNVMIEHIDGTVISGNNFSNSARSRRGIVGTMDNRLIRPKEMIRDKMCVSNALYEQNLDPFTHKLGKKEAKEDLGEQHHYYEIVENDDNFDRKVKNENKIDSNNVDLKEINDRASSPILKRSQSLRASFKRKKNALTRSLRLKRDTHNSNDDFANKKSTVATNTNKSSTSSSQLRPSSQRLFENRLYCCNLCDASFLENFFLRTHIRNCHSTMNLVKPIYKCGQCSRTFFGNRKFRKHCQNHRFRILHTS